MLIRHRQFRGERPKLSARLLGEGEAQVALDCDLVSGELRPIFSNRVIDGAPDPDAETLFIIDGEIFTWPGDVSVAETPVNAAVRRLFWSGDGFPQQAEVEELEAGISYLLGIPKPIGRPEVYSITGSGESGALPVTSLYRYTFVNKWGEEGDASDPSDLFDYTSGQTLRIRGLGPGGNALEDLQQYGIVAYRLYRLAEGESKFVGEYEITLTSVVDALKESELGETLSSEDFYPPPTNLQGLHIMANGIALGFVGQTVYVSEPYNPNAWPYSVILSSPVVAISSFDNSAVFLTEGYPEVATIFDPRNLTTSVLAEREPCLTRRGVVQGAGGVIYPAPSGLFYIGAGGARMLTEAFLDDIDWQRLNPASFTAVYRDGEYIAFYSTVTESGGWIFDMREPTSVIRRLSQWASAAFVAEGTDELYLVNGSVIELYQGGLDRLTYTWRGKLHGEGSYFALTSRRLVSRDFADNPTDSEIADAEAANAAEHAANLARIAAIGGRATALGGALGQSVLGGASVAGSALNRLSALPITFHVQLTVYGDGDAVHSETVVNEGMDRITYTDRKRLWEIELIGNAHLTQSDLASSFSEMHTGN